MTSKVRWGMVIDLRKCFGCGACVVACAEANQVTPNLWRRVFDCGVSRPPGRKRLYLPLSCMHCNEPPCEKVCPTTATFQRADGIVDIDDTKCIGCGYCIVACPYFARVIIFLNEYNLDIAQKRSEYLAYRFVKFYNMYIRDTQIKDIVIVLGGDCIFS